MHMARKPPLPQREQFRLARRERSREETSRGIGIGLAAAATIELAWQIGARAVGTGMPGAWLHWLVAPLLGGAIAGVDARRRRARERDEDPANSVADAGTQAPSR